MFRRKKKKQRWARLAVPSACWHQFCPKFDVKQSPNLYLKVKTKQRPVLDRSLLFLFHFFFSYGFSQPHYLHLTWRYFSKADTMLWEKKTNKKKLFCSTAFTSTERQIVHAMQFRWPYCGFWQRLGMTVWHLQSSAKIVPAVSCLLSNVFFVNILSAVW